MPIVFDICWGWWVAGGVSSNDDSDDDFRWGYRSVSQYHRLPSVTSTITWKIKLRGPKVLCVQTTYCLTLIIKSGSYEIL